MGIIVRSNSNYISPCFPILKKKGAIRLIVDYRKLNSRTIKDGYPIPELTDKILALRTSRVFSTIDLNMGYYQLMVEKESQKYTAFVVNHQVFEFTRMPFGLTNAPRSFQRAMAETLKDLNHIEVFMDDIVVHSEDIENHVLHLKALFERLRSANISINFSKCQFNKIEITYLGMIIREGIIEPDLSRLQKLDFKIPKTRRQLQQILGLLNWYRPFLKQMSGRIIDITERLKNKNYRPLDERDIQVLKDLFNELNSGVQLHFPDEHEDFILECDASEVALGAALYQKQKLIDLFSKKLTDTERKYPIQEKEALGIIRALEHFCKIVFNTHIIVRCDNRNLLFDKIDYRQKTQHWKILLCEYDITFEAIKGIDNYCADYLSRNVAIKTFQTPINFEQFPENYKTDLVALKLQAKNELKEAEIKGTKLLLDNERRIYIPVKLCSKVLEKIHNQLGHRGSTKLYETLKKFYTAISFTKKIKTVVRSCRICQEVKSNTYSYGIQQCCLHSEKPFYLIYADILGPFTSEILAQEIDTEIFYLLTIIDACTRIAQTKVLVKITGIDVVDCFRSWVRRNGTPSIVITDQGKQFGKSELNGPIFKHLNLPGLTLNI